MKFFNVLLIVLLLVGCSTKFSNIDYKISREKKKFIDGLNPMGIIDIKKNAIKVYTVLPEAANNIIFKIKIPEARNIVTIKSVNNLVNINEIMIKNQDFFYDKQNKVLLINFNIPYIYFLKNKISYDLDIIYVNNDKKLKIFRRKFIFFYKGMKKSDGDYLSYKYIPLTDFKNLDNINKKHLEKELKLINKNRVSSEYKKLIDIIEEEI